MTRIHWNQISHGSNAFTPCGAGRKRGARTANPPQVTRNRDEVTCIKCRDYLGG